MHQLPVFLNLHGRPCLLVGGGSIAARKLDLLLKARAQVTVVAPTLSEPVAALHRAGDIHYLPREFQVDDVLGHTIVIAATDQQRVNEQVYHSAQRQNIPVNVVDTPSLCSFTFGAIVERDPVTIAISSAGNAPVLARSIRTLIETRIPWAFSRLTAFIAQYQTQVQQRCADLAQSLRFWQRIAQGPLAEWVYIGRTDVAERRLQTLLPHHQSASGGPAAVGDVYLIGAGPGDPELLTFRALRLLQKADVVFYDRLVSDGILSQIRFGVERFYVGKQRAQHCVPQQEINQYLIDYARRGKTVVRLKGGDPFVFGRGGEEMEALLENGIDVQVVPGITAAVGCGAYAGIPLTHREYAQTVRFITGHTKDGKLQLDWNSLATTTETLVFYMGLTNLEHICEQLIAHGLAAEFPAAVITQGTTQQQRVLISDLTELPQQVRAAALASPSLLIVGNVVKLGQRLAWFAKQPARVVRQ